MVVASEQSGGVQHHVKQAVDRAWGQRYVDVPEDVATTARLCLLDTLGVALAGAGEPAAVLLRDELLTNGDGDGATVWGTASRSSPFLAALCNGTAAHALDFDDWAPASRAHPSSVLVPAVLAAAEQVDASGRDVLNAFIAGYELQETVGLLLGTQHYHRGFHTTATIGALGAAAAAGKVLGLDRGELTTAINLAATQAAGLKSMFGTMGKPFHAGRAASTGVLSARLAKRGFTAGADGLAGPQGFLDVFAGEALIAGSGGDGPDPDVWHLLDVKFKEHVSCFGTHAAIEAALVLRADPNFDIAQVAGLSVTLNPELAQVCLIPAPTTRLEAKFSVAFSTAVALSGGRVAEADLTCAAIASTVLRHLTANVRIEYDPAFHPLEATTRAHLLDGRVLESHQDISGRRWSAGPEELVPRLTRKFRSLVDGLTLQASSRQMEASVLNLHRSESVSDLTWLLASLGQ